MLDLLKHMCDFDINKKLVESSSRLGISTKPVHTIFIIIMDADNAEHHYLRSKKYIDENFKLAIK